MIVLHAIWSAESVLSIWGEDSSLTTRRPKQSSRKKKKQKVKEHPFACEADWLREAVGTIGGAIVADSAGEEGHLKLLLPGTELAPQRSPHLPLEETGEQAAPSGLSRWRVPALIFDSKAALDLLISLPEGKPAGLVIGESFRYFGELAKLALEVVARGRALPSLVRRKEEFFALWQPRLNDEADLERLRLFARNMPPLCRAEAVDESLEGRKPDLILRDMLESMADSAIRQSLDQISLLPARKGRRPEHRKALESWVRALSDDSPNVRGKTSELIKLQESLDEWKSQALSRAEGTLRTCFRLSPPAAQDEGKRKTARGKQDPAHWRVEFLLQATDDKSLLVPARTIWKTRGSALTFSSRRLENPQEKLLEDLGRATRLYPGLESALKTARPEAMDVNVEGAYDFLREAAPLLEQSGFGVIVPHWWKKPAARLGVKLTSKPKGASTTGSGLLGLDGICDYRWQIALGDEELSFDDFIKIASLKVPLVKMRGQWVELKREEIEAALAFFKKHEVTGEMSVGEALRMGLGLGASKVGLPVVGFEAKGWLGDLFETNGKQHFAPLKTPRGFSGKLRPYQERGLSWLAFLEGLGLGACLADDMGLGKTIELLALLTAERQNGRNKKAVRTGPTLLVCPMSVVGNWQREAERFTPSLKVHVHHGADRLSGRKFSKQVEASDLVLTTYALAARDQSLLSKIDWSRIALDEAQNIKNPSARQTQAVRSFKAARRVALTGTPVENRLSELWSIMEFLNPGLLGSASDFRTRFATPIERYRDEEKARLLKRLTGPFLLRRLKTDKKIIKDLPDKIEMKSFCNLTEEQASLYQAVVDEMIEKIETSEGIERKGLVLSTLMKLKQVCNHPAHLLQDSSSLEGRSGKLARLEELLEEILSEGDKVLCFTQFAEMGHRLKEYLQDRFGREVLFLHGGTTKKARDRMVERFQKSDESPIFLLSLKAGGTGLNLTAASHVIHFDRWWNPAVEDQATDRAFRIGQKKNVQVRKFVCVGTLEERIDQMIEQKKELAGRIVGAGEAWLTELSTDQIRDLVKLSADAVSE